MHWCDDKTITTHANLQNKTTIKGNGREMFWSTSRCPNRGFQHLPDPSSSPCALQDDGHHPCFKAVVCVCVHDYWSVALISIGMKYFRQVFMRHLKSNHLSTLDPFQYIYYIIWWEHHTCHHPLVCDPWGPFFYFYKMPSRTYQQHHTEYQQIKAVHSVHYCLHLCLWCKVYLQSHHQLWL